MSAANWLQANGFRSAGPLNNRYIRASALRTSRGPSAPASGLFARNGQAVTANHGHMPADLAAVVAGISNLDTSRHGAPMSAGSTHPGPQQLGVPPGNCRRRAVFLARALPPCFGERGGHLRDQLAGHQRPLRP